MPDYSNRTFASLGEFAAFIATAGVQRVVADAQARSIVAAELTHAVKDRIGKPELLPPPLADSTVADRVAKGYSPYETLLRDGTLRASIGWDNESLTETVVGSTDPKAVYHELGTPHVPKRSFLASTASEQNDKLFALYAETFAKRFLRGGIVPSEPEADAI